MSRVFDPLGLLAPVTVKIKIFFQRLWTPIESDGQSMILDWDDELPENYRQEWDSYQNGMLRINKFRIPRVLCLAGTVRCEPQGFSDASERAYSAIVYLRWFGWIGNSTAHVCKAQGCTTQSAVNSEVGIVRSSTFGQTDKYSGISYVT
jgi:hypothetical protein